MSSLPPIAWEKLPGARLWNWLSSFPPTFDRLQLWPGQQGGGESPQVAVRAQGEIPEIGLFLEMWRGQTAETQANWLQRWTADGNLLLWGIEQVEQERQQQPLPKPVGNNSA